MQNRSERWIVGLGTYSSFFNAAVSMLYSVTAILIITELEIDSTTLGLILSIFMWGQILGGLFWGYVGDLIGRKKTWIGTICMMAAGALFAALSPNWFMLALGRALSGFGTVGSQAPMSAYVTETTKRDRRSKYFGLMWSMWSPAVIIISIISLGGLQWRYAWALWAIIGLTVVLLINHHLKETERYQKYDKEVGGTKEKALGTLALFSNRRWRKNMIIASTIAFGQLATLWSYTTYMPVYMKSIGYSSIVGIQWSLIAWGIGTPIGCLLWAVLADRLGRRGTLAFLGILTAVSETASFMWATTEIAIYITSIFSIAGLLGVYSGILTYFPELFPTKIRSTGFGVSNQVGRIFSSFAPIVCAAVISQTTMPIGVSILNLAWIPMLIALVFAPETKNRSIDELEILESSGHKTIEEVASGKLVES